MAGAGIPPTIDGYAHVRWLGGGGFAEVYEYKQLFPERPVAIKVLNAAIDDAGTRELFVAEANLMAKVARHPNIVEIYGAGESVDRRPYLVMEYYSSGHLGGEKLKTNPLPYQSVLEIGVKISGAVEDAHRARVIHRDIKPENILISGAGPALTDFGIAAVQTDTHTDESRGYSPGYAPVEIIENTHPGDARSDVYSLAATLWALLAGHSPFERPDRRSTNGEIMARAMKEPVPALPRGVPAPLETLLRRALEKDPARRPQTAQEFGRELQRIERELGLRETQMVIIHDSSIESAAAEVAAVVEKTKAGRGLNLDLGAAGGGTAIRGGPAGKSLWTTDRRDGADGVRQERQKRSGTNLRRTAGEEKPELSPVDDRIETRRPTWLLPAIGGAALVVAVVVLAAVLGGGKGARPAEADSSAVEVVANPGKVNQLVVAPVSDLTGHLDDGVATFEWAHEGRPSGVDFLVQRIDGGTSGAEAVGGSPYVIEGVAEGVVPCVTVTARVQGQAESEPSDPVCATR